MPASPVHGEFGPLLRSWRTQRGLSQERLAFQAEISTRHLSFLETGRSAPSREMALILAGSLDLPLREQNVLLRAAGFAPVFRESALDGPELDAVSRALDHILAAQEPHAAVVFDRAWNVKRTNAGASRLLGWAMEGKSPPPEVMSNGIKLLLHPEGLRDLVPDWERLAAGLIWRTRREQAARPDPRIDALLTDLLKYPGIPERMGSAIVDEVMAGRPFLGVRLERDGVTLDFFTTLTSLGTPLDVTAEDTQIESYFPANDRTDAFVRGLAGRPQA